MQRSATRASRSSGHGWGRGESLSINSRPTPPSRRAVSRSRSERPSAATPKSSSFDKRNGVYIHNTPSAELAVLATKSASQLVRPVSGASTVSHWHPARDRCTCWNHFRGASACSWSLVADVCFNTVSNIMVYRIGPIKSGAKGQPVPSFKISVWFAAHRGRIKRGQGWVAGCLLRRLGHPAHATRTKTGA